MPIVFVHISLDQNLGNNKHDYGESPKNDVEGMVMPKSNKSYSDNNRPKMLISSKRDIQISN
jgi:hypothetical protein